MNKWKTKFSYWKFDKKILLLVTVSILIVTLTVAGVSLTFSIASMKEQSVELLQMQNNTVVESFKGSMDSYKEIVLGTIMDDSVQNYCRQVQKNELKTADIDAVYSKLENLNNMYESLNFASIVSSDYKSYYYRGKGSLSVTQFEEVYPQAYERSKYAQKGTLKVAYNNEYYNDYYKGNRYTLSLYYPLYDTRKVSDARGLLCMNFDDPAVQRMLAVGDSSAETRVVDTGGMILLSNDKEETGRYVNYIDEMEKGIQIFTKNGNMYVCQKIKNWNYYVVSSISFYKLMESGFHIMVVVILVLIIVLIIVSIIIRALVRKMYQPLNKVVSKMDHVATGSLRTRINVDNMGEDFAKLAIGFNSMMDEIEVLMEQVKLEQHQLEQIRFNALQSQIQPHFLYNTLECIHWQAIAEGNKEISTMVKALAKYYRICLSKGHDVITIREEVEHIRNYMIIQNMRYDNIIGSEIVVESQVEESLIPKLTLQPLVENSIYHGMKVKEGKTGTLYLTAYKNEDEVIIKVSDTGTGMSQEQIDEMNEQLSRYEDSFGYGVRNVNKRIELLFGEGYGLNYQKNDSGGVTVVIHLPYQTEIKKNTAGGEWTCV